MPLCRWLSEYGRNQPMANICLETWRVRRRFWQLIALEVGLYLFAPVPAIAQQPAKLNEKSVPSTVVSNSGAPIAQTNYSFVDARGSVHVMRIIPVPETVSEVRRAVRAAGRSEGAIALEFGISRETVRK